MSEDQEDQQLGTIEQEEGFCVVSSTPGELLCQAERTANLPTSGGGCGG